MSVTFGTPFPLANQRYTIIRLDDAKLLLANFGSEWAYTTPTEESLRLPDQGNTSDLPDGLDWTRWTASDSDSQVLLTPHFPHLPLVARTRGTITIPPGSSAGFTLSIPAVIQVQFECNGSLRHITSVPSRTLTKTWHGNQHVGDPSYILDTKARREIANHEEFLQDILCQIDIRNSSKNPLTFQRLFIETKHLSIFQKHGQLWSSSSRLKVRDTDEAFTRFIVGRTPDGAGTDAALVTNSSSEPDSKTQIYKAFFGNFDVLSY